MMQSATGTAWQMAGPAGAPVVVLIHGLGLPRPTWAPFEAALSAEFRVLSYHLYGHGETAAPPEPPSLRVYAEQLRALMDELEIARAALVGFSLGGMINRRFAMDFGARVTALAILNSPHERGETQQALVEQRAKDTSSGGPGATLDATITRWFTPDFIAANPGVIETVRNCILANDAEIYAQCRWVLAHGVRELIRPDPPITHPTLVMTCAHDSGSTPAMSQAIGAEIAGSETLIVPALQHLGLIERPELFIDPLAAFLRRHI